MACDMRQRPVLGILGIHQLRKEVPANGDIAAGQ